MSNSNVEFLDQNNQILTELLNEPRSTEMPIRENDLCPHREKMRALIISSSRTKPVSSSKSKVLSFVHVILTLFEVTKNRCCQVFDVSEHVIFLPCEDKAVFLSLKNRKFS